MGKGIFRYVSSYEPLGEPESAPGNQGQPDEAVSDLFQQVSDMVLTGGPLGRELTHLDAVGRSFTFRQAPEPDARAVVDTAGGVPAASSPAWAHLAWLLRELPFVHAFREYGQEGGPTLRGVEAPSRRWADVLTEHHGERWRVRVALEGRTEPIEFPGMAIGELFGEGRHRTLAVEGEPHLVYPGI
ncbi:hypothetical protein [Streptomyces sp. Rer75]|uniref:hypothetical protein n=1 Tax=unclassified Streptomyces TaxID=2593676 RepID=UPI0015CFCC0E|nr:hypothetical protein [Streptomyces sp. Rer75]QLH21635.1 hypothetical protein HYQ63_14225 [Streptomyces sp. Rer75]